jgi:hypothetical protein
MKARRFLRTHRLSIQTTVTVALAAVGLAAFTASAYATFTLSTGTLKLTNGTTKGTPPGGSWVELTSKDPGGGAFENPAGLAENPDYTLILGSGATGLELGQAQPTGGIFGPLTYFGLAIPSDLFSALTLTGSAPSLTFSGSASETGTRTLTGGNLLGLRILYAGSLYNVATQTGSGPDIVIPLEGTITGNATKANKATILLHWETALLEPGFSLFNALFHWEGLYTP